MIPRCAILNILAVLIFPLTISNEKCSAAQYLESEKTYVYIAMPDIPLAFMLHKLPPLLLPVFHCSQPDLHHIHQVLHNIPRNQIIYCKYNDLRKLFDPYNNSLASREKISVIIICHGSQGLFGTVNLIGETGSSLNDLFYQRMPSWIHKLGIVGCHARKFAESLTLFYRANQYREPIILTPLDSKVELLIGLESVVEQFED